MVHLFQIFATLLIAFSLLVVGTDSKYSGKSLIGHIQSFKSSINKWRCVFKPKKTVRKEDRLPKVNPDEAQMTSVS